MAPSPPSSLSPAPFILTAELPSDVFRWADSLRRAHYPPERNVLQAHVTLFHSFAPSLREELLRTTARFAAEFAPCPARAEGLLNLGSGTALAVHSPAMSDLRAAIAEHFSGALTAQDLSPPRLHITIQNKVGRAESVALQRELAGYPERVFRFPALGLHIYRVTHWETLRIWPLRGKQGA